MEEKVSIIIPVYNAEKYLHRCAQSILNQSYENWETIFVNDGSTDSSLDVLQKLAESDKRFRVITKDNGGAASARNVGLNEVQSSYLTFVDADDSIHPDFLLHTLKAAIDNNCDLVVTGICFQGRDYPSYLSGVITMKPSQYAKCVTGSPCAKLYKRELIRDAGLHFPEDMLYKEDYVFTMSYALLVNKYYVIQSPMYNYIFDAEDSISHIFCRSEMKFSHYENCLEAPWRVLWFLQSNPNLQKHALYSKWVYTLYNELWKTYYFTLHFINKRDKKKLLSHFEYIHQHYTPHVHYIKRIWASERHPCIYKLLKKIGSPLKKLLKHKI